MDQQSDTNVLVRRTLNEEEYRDQGHSVGIDDDLDLIRRNLTPDELLANARLRFAEIASDDVPFRVSLVFRLFEIFVAASVLIVTAPVMLWLAYLIRQGTPGPTIFRQNRVAAGLTSFRFFKFRTLYVDAKQRFPELYAYQYSPSEIQELQFKIENDPRVTPQGQWMRSSTLDELPNFWNVLIGNMALVGPRPEIPEMLPYYEGRLLKKFAVRPGITGLAQISGRGRLSFFETAEYDLEYVENRSFWLDLKILAKTIYKILVRDGAF